MTKQKTHRFAFNPKVKYAYIQDSELLFPVGKVYCVGRNYTEHAKEMGVNVDTDQPFFFSKPSQAITQLASIPFPTQTDDLQHEVELVVFLRSECSNISPSESRQHIFGYGVGVDLTKRDLQAAAKDAGKPWELSKGFDNSAPISKILKKEGQLLNRGSISLKVNGQLRQYSDISNMTWGVDKLISELSKFITLNPGDIIFTGTPSGVGEINKDDILQGFIGMEKLLEIKVK